MVRRFLQPQRLRAHLNKYIIKNTTESKNLINKKGISVNVLRAESLIAVKEVIG